MGLVQTIRDLEARLDAVSRQVEQQAASAAETAETLRRELDGHVANLQAKFGPDTERRVIAKCGSGRHKVHLAQEIGAEAPPILWRTACGLSYAKWAFTRHRASSEFPGTSSAPSASARSRRRPAEARLRDLRRRGQVDPRGRGEPARQLNAPSVDWFSPLAVS